MTWALDAGSAFAHASTQEGNMLLEGKVAIVTGGSRGIGRSNARLLAREGASVLDAGRDEAGCAATVASITAEEGRATAVLADVSSAREVAHLVDRAVKTYGGVDILVNNAGLDVGKPLLETSEADWDLVMSVNLKGHFLCAVAVVPYMVARGGGSIVNTASILALASLPDCGAYCASKAGILGLTRSMALEWGSLGIRVNCVLPGSTDTDMMWLGLAPEDIPVERARVEASTPLGRIAEPEEIAEATLWFCSTKASFASGSLLLLDGGTLSRSPNPR
jgi:NAD(P)-dependent dehydrogenase (short-subunit alcohol dehydrogenase family)